MKMETFVTAVLRISHVLVPLAVETDSVSEMLRYKELETMNSVQISSHVQAWYSLNELNRFQKADTGECR
jgi:hypothetical protein